MKASSRHHPVEDLLGVYALDALPSDEVDAVERHLDGCGRCRAEVAQHRQTAAVMAALVETPLGNGGGPAPEGIWKRIAAELDGEAPSQPLAPLVPFRSSSPAPSSWTFAPVLAVAAVVSLVVALGLGAVVVRQNSRIDTLSVSNERQAELAAALVDPAARRVQLTSPTGVGTVGAVMTRDGNAYLVPSGVPGVPADRTYQLWAISGGIARSVAVLGNRPGPLVHIRMPETTEVLAITVEPAGGVEQPTSEPVLSGVVPAASA